MPFTSLMQMPLCYVTLIFPFSIWLALHAKKKIQYELHMQKIGTSQSGIPACRNKWTRVCCLGSFFLKLQIYHLPFLIIVILMWWQTVALEFPCIYTLVQFLCSEAPNDLSGRYCKIFLEFLPKQKMNIFMLSVVIFHRRNSYMHIVANQSQERYFSIM